MLAPYRLTDMYIRMALAELTSFIFLPMVFQGVYLIFHGEEETKKPEIILILGAVGLILSHLVIAMYTAIIAGIYVLVNIKKLKEIKVIRKLAVSFILILCITSFFWLPMLEQKQNAQYEVFAPGRMERTGVMIYYKLDALDLFRTKKDKVMVLEIGLITLIGVILTPFAWKKRDRRYKEIYIFSLIVGLMSVIMTLKWFPFEKLPSILKMLQFSFRMLEFSSFFLAIVACINYGLLIKNFNTRDVLILSILSILLTAPFLKHIKYDNAIDESKLWPAIPVTENTLRVHAGCASFEYLPSKAFIHLDYIKKREDKSYLIEGNAIIQKEEKNGTNMRLALKEIEAGTKIELPYIYYLGYEVVLNSGGENTKLPIYESENGFVEVCLGENIEEAEIKVDYPGTTIMRVSAIISLLGFTSIMIYACMVREKK